MCAIITDVGEVDYFDSAQDKRRRRHDDVAIVPSAKHMMQR
jgi:hypothetical protein